MNAKDKHIGKNCRKCGRPIESEEEIVSRGIGKRSHTAYYHLECYNKLFL